MVWILVGSGGCKTIQWGLEKQEELSKIPNFAAKSWARSRAHHRSGKVPDVQLVGMVLGGSAHNASYFLDEAFPEGIEPDSSS